MSIKKKLQAAAAIATLTASAVVGKASAGETQKQADKDAVKAAAQIDIQQINATRVWEQLSPSMKRSFAGQDIAVKVNEPTNVRGEHYPRSPKLRIMKYDQVVDVLDPSTDRPLAQETRKVREFTEQKLYWKYPDMRQINYADVYYDADGDVYMRAEGVRSQHFHKDRWGHEPHNPIGVTTKSTGETTYTAALDKAPWGEAVKVVEGMITNGVSKTVSKKGKTIWIYENSWEDEETKTSGQEKWEIMRRKDGGLKIKKVSMRADQSHYPQTASINYTSGKLNYQLSQDGQVSIQAKMTERDRTVIENECWSLHDLAKRFMRRWAKKVGIIFDLPYPSTEPRYPHRHNKVAAQAPTVAEQAEKKLLSQKAELLRLQGHNKKFYNRGRQHG